MDQYFTIRFLKGIGLSIAASVFSGSAVFAGDTKKQIEFFLGTCFGSLDDVSRVQSLAALLKWKNAPADFANLGKPVNSIKYETWLVQKEGEFYAVAVNQAPWNDRQIANVCSVAIQSSGNAVIAELTRVIKLKKVHEEDEPLQTTSYYEYESMAVDRAMVSVVALKDGSAPVSLGVTGIRNNQ